MLNRFQIQKWPRCPRFRRWVSNYGELWTNTWLWETASITFSGICIILIFSILLRYDQKPVPQFTYGITLNAIISTLTTFSKSFLLVAVTGAISQLKWRWFQSTKGRRIIDTQLFDDASRGPWGSLVFLATPSRWSLASAGPVVSILALAFEPITQQLTTYIARQVVIPTSKTDIPIDAVNKLQGRLAGAVWDSSSEAESFVTEQCLTGNCSWDHFESLAFCAPCQERADDIKLSDSTLSWNSSVAQLVIENGAAGGSSGYSLHKNISLHLPLDLALGNAKYELSVETEFFLDRIKPELCVAPRRISYPGHFFTVHRTGYMKFEEMAEVAWLNDGALANLSGFTRWQSYKLPILRFHHIQFEIKNQHEQARISVKNANSCDLTPCIKNYSLSISNGVPTMDVVSERYGSWYYNITSQKRDPYDPYYVNTEIWWTDIPGRNGMILNASDIDPYTDSSPGDFALSLEWNTNPFYKAYDLGLYTGELTTYETLAADGQNCISNITGIHFHKNYPPDSGPFYYAGEDVFLTRIKEMGGLTLAFPRIAAAASRYLRDEGADAVEGEAYRSIIVVEVRWPWLVLPVTTWLCAVVFLALTMWLCRGSDKVLWKTSSLPLIYHGFEDQDVATAKSTDGGIERVSGMEKVSQSLYARIRRDSNDGQLKLMRTLPST
ncbi:hypothetical protein F5B22DRAFT_656736 [Xylaria bambusicola]|uniref:uncharacterized protein n=1 Tax=Xylaria bambusicola TaxID=326684 RepID=UPI00200793D9|nr:uncharacterized protein F5B22DRAFT_656736 [Xylaria bambusicola]KAI0514514.1 hypothetical protein F5B22DRAFT_656736 [Xylaria bambusicola]